MSEDGSGSRDRGRCDICGGAVDYTVFGGEPIMIHRVCRGHLGELLGNLPGRVYIVYPSNPVRKAVLAGGLEVG